MIRHLPGAEMPADLGTKVLSGQKFNHHKETMGMFSGSLENLEKAEDGEQTETPSRAARREREGFEDHHFRDQAVARGGIHGIRKGASNSTGRSRSQSSFAAE